jgi:hypothetical protein
LGFFFLKTNLVSYALACRYLSIIRFSVLYFVLSNSAYMKKSIFITTILFLIFLTGIWDKYLLTAFKVGIEHFFFGSPLGLVRQIAAFLNQKIPSIMENFAYFFLALLHAFLCALCLKIYLNWQFKTFLRHFLACFAVFFVGTIAITWGFADTKNHFYKMWYDFKELFFSPFPLIFMFLTSKLLRK